MAVQSSSIIAGTDLERYRALQSMLIEFHTLFNEATPVNERAIAIVGASYLDTLLEHTLINLLVDDEKEVRQLLRPDGALGTYGNRTTAAYCLGLIGEVVRNDLRTVGKIRNRFAHQLDASFDKEPVTSWCRALKWHEVSMMMKAPDGATARELFQVGVNQLICHLNGLVGVARLERRQVPG